uniref:mitogen-activated protein kinase kinase n=1 Tax=Amorphochlora amoebiformis TaxID=1561963 RepID=A0A7S0CZR5_9EUKA
MEPAPELMFTEEVNSPLLDLLRDAPASQKEIVTRLLDGQRFIHLVRPKFGFWKRKKCHLVLTQDLMHIVYSPIKGETAGGKVHISTADILNVTCSMYGVNNPPADLKDLKTLSIIYRDERDTIGSKKPVISGKKRSRASNRPPRSTVMHLTPDTNCVQLGEIVEFTEQMGNGDISKDGEVIEYNLDNPSVVLVRVLETEEMISVVGETLNRNGEFNSAQTSEAASKTVWDWYNGLVKVKMLVACLDSIESGMMDTERKRNDEERALKAIMSRKSWHKKALTWGTVFTRAFVGGMLRDSKVIPNCYVRCSADLSQMLYAPLACFSDKASRILLKDEISSSDMDLETLNDEFQSLMKSGSKSTSVGTWILSKVTKDFVPSPSMEQRLKSRSQNSTPHSANYTIMSPNKTHPAKPVSPPHAAPPKKGTSETLALLIAGNEMYHENLVRQMVAGANANKKYRSRPYSKHRESKDSKHNRRTSFSVFSKSAFNNDRRLALPGMKERGFFVKGASRKIRVLEVNDLTEILTDSQCPAFAGTRFSIGLRFMTKNKECIISFECRTRGELDRWHRQFRYLKEIKGGVTMPVNVRAGFRMQGDLKWQGSFEEHFEFFCPQYHKMSLEVGEACRDRVCTICHMKANRDTMFFHVCSHKECDHEMCTKCAKEASKIGEGGFSEVHLAINKNMVDRPPCVIKIFKNMMGHSTLKKMVMETDVLFRLQAHPNIVKYQGYGGPNENGQLWMVMEFCDGGSVLDLRKGMKTLMAESHIAYILHCVLRALAFLHSKGIAHKDIKAANILLTMTGFVKLSDFGISEQVKQNSEVLEFAGSPLWMPPEAYKNEVVDQKGDIWSFGITAIELAEGKPPFFGMPITKVAQEAVAGPAPSLKPKSLLDKEPRKDDPGEWSEGFQKFLSKCFVKDAKERPSAQCLLDDPFMDEDQFKLTTFCNRLMNVMQDAGIFEMSNASQAVGEEDVQHKNVPALICRKSLLYLIKNKNYKEADQKEEIDSKGEKIEEKMSSIKHRLFAKGTMVNNGKEQGPANEPEDRRRHDITSWGFIRTLQQKTMEQKPVKLPRQRMPMEPINEPGNRRPSDPKVGSETVTEKARIPVLDLGGHDLTKTKTMTKIPKLNLGDDDLTKTRDTRPIPQLNLGEDDLTKTQPKAIIPTLNLGNDDLTKTQNFAELNGKIQGTSTQGTSVRGPNPSGSTPPSTNIPRKMAKPPEQQGRRRQLRLAGVRLRGDGSPRFLDQAKNDTFKITTDEAKRVFKTKSHFIDSTGNFVSRNQSRSTADTKHLLYRREELVHIRHLGRGAAGFVVKSFHIPTRRFVALKHMSVDNAKQRHQLDKELTAFVQVQHPEIVKLHGAYFEGERIVICLEYMDLGSLENVIRTRKRIPEKQLSQMAKQALLGVCHIHKKRFIHRDIKPDNFLVSTEGKVKVADFGLMRQLRSDETGSFTKTGTMCYLSPERIAGAKFSYPADIWALGISLYFCATGKLPIPKDFWSLVDAISKKPSPKLDSKEFSSQCCNFIDLCLTKDPKKRGTAEQLLRHPFITNANSKKDLSKYLTSVDERKALRKRAEHEITLMAREIWHNRERSAGNDVFLNTQIVTSIAQQLRVKPSYLIPIARNAWLEAGKIPGGKSFEFWKPSTRRYSSDLADLQ